MSSWFSKNKKTKVAQALVDIALEPELDSAS